MEYNNGEKHLKVVNHVSILEAIDEVFDGATSLLTKNSVMYGSTITALIANLPICGDLDVAVSKMEYSKLCQNFASSAKWIQVSGIPVKEKKIKPKFSFGDGFSHNLPPTHTLSSQPINQYGGVKHLPVSGVITFKTVNGSCVQIIESSSVSGDAFTDAVNIVRNVDFTFCGIAVDRYGRMLEVIPHAYSDCLQRAVRIQNYNSEIDPERLRNRIFKYVHRGWDLTFSIDQAMLNLTKIKRIEKDRRKISHEKKKGITKRTKKLSAFSLRPLSGKNAEGFVITMLPDFTKQFFNTNIDMRREFISKIKIFSYQTYKVELGVLNLTSGSMEFKPRRINVILTKQMATTIIITMDIFIRQVFNIDYIKYFKKKRKL